MTGAANNQERTWLAVPDAGAAEGLKPSKLLSSQGGHEIAGLMEAWPVCDLHCNPNPLGWKRVDGALQLQLSIIARTLKNHEMLPGITTQGAAAAHS